MAISQVLDSVENRLTDVEGRLDNVENRLTNVEGRLTKIELTQENDILPRLQNTESCYLSTFDRYQEHTSSYKTMESDIELLKKSSSAFLRYFILF